RAGRLETENAERLGGDVAAQLDRAGVVFDELHLVGRRPHERSHDRARRPRRRGRRHQARALEQNAGRLLRLFGVVELQFQTAAGTEHRRGVGRDTELADLRAGFGVDAAGELSVERDGELAVFALRDLDAALAGAAQAFDSDHSIEAEAVAVTDAELVDVLFV